MQYGRNQQQYIIKSVFIFYDMYDRTLSNKKAKLKR